MSGRPEWFAPKRYGYGAGLPIAWQGWAVLGVFIAAIMAASFLLAPVNQLAFIAVVVLLIGLLMIITARTTRGGMRWRWGEKE